MKRLSQLYLSKPNYCFNLIFSNAKYYLPSYYDLKYLLNISCEFILLNL